MLRMSAIVIAAVLLVACDDSSMNQYAYREGPAESTSAPADIRPMGLLGGEETSAYRGRQQPQSGESYTYDHALSVTMASEHIKARFERARDRCEKDAGLKCKVMSASYSLLGSPGAPLPVAYLSVAMPHDGIAPFEASLLVPLPGEDAADVAVRSRSTTAQNVTQQVTDLDRRIAQLTDYRDRLQILSKRGNASTDDLIKIEGEISRAQTELEQLDAQKRTLAERIARENLTITFEAQSTVGDALQPMRDVWQSSLRILGESAGAALGFTIRALPWIPVVVLAFFLFRWLWRRVRRKPA